MGGLAATYCPVGNISTWVKTVDQLVINPNYSPELEIRLAQAQKYSWSTHANIIAEAYLNLK